MREALAARSGDDFIIDKPARQPRRKKAAPKPGVGTVIMMAALRHPGEIFAGLLLSGCAGIIAYNALVLQKARHPAPLFGKVVAKIPAPVPPNRPQAAGPDTVTTPEQLAPQPQSLVPSAPATMPAANSSAPTPARPSTHNAIGDLIRNGAEMPPGQATLPPSRPAIAIPGSMPGRSGPSDPIADMIRMGGPVPVPPGTVARVEPDDTVAAAQRALAKLGYAVKVDGVAGPGTRQAIESFERDRHLTVTGELGARTIRELTAQSGIPIQ